MATATSTAAPRTFAACVCDAGADLVTLAFEPTYATALTEALRTIDESRLDIDPADIHIVEIALYASREEADGAGVTSADWVLFGEDFCPAGYEVCARVGESSHRDGPSLRASRKFTIRTNIGDFNMLDRDGFLTAKNCADRLARRLGHRSAPLYGENSDGSREVLFGYVPRGNDAYRVERMIRVWFPEGLVA